MIIIISVYSSDHCGNRAVRVKQLLRHSNNIRWAIRNECAQKVSRFINEYYNCDIFRFTGYLGITSVVVKGTTNAIRMEWNATSGAHVRGWHVKVGSVAE